MKKQTNILFYILSIYVLLQFLWWGYHLIELSKESSLDETHVTRKILMIVGEGAVFLLILVFGLYKISTSIRKELTFSQRQSNFLLSITHELKTPIAATKLYLQTLNKRVLSEDKKADLLNKALEENERLELLIDNILNASRLDNKALSPVQTELDFTTIANLIIDRFTKRFPSITIQLDLEDNCIFMADRFMIETILMNLVENAIKYAGSNAKISIFFSKNQNFITFGVKDDGPGIADEEKEIIFNKFHRLGNEETRETKGSGLGLYIVSEFVRLHHGTIFCKNNRSKGATFEINLPI